jgi:hypothetical protein
MNLKEIAAQYKDYQAFLEAVATKVLELADAQPTFQYSPERGYRCRYNRRATRDIYTDSTEYGPECKGCIIGQALQLLGWDNSYELNRIMSVTTLLNEHVNPIFSGLSLTLQLQLVQTNQDSSLTWGSSVIDLRKYMASLSANAPATEA